MIHLYEKITTHFKDLFIHQIDIMMTKIFEVVCHVGILSVRIKLYEKNKTQKKTYKKI